jgi:hypothetical protein
MSLVHPTMVGGGKWHNLFSPVTLSSSGSGFNNYNIRTQIAAAAYLQSTNSNLIRVTLQGSAANPNNVNAAWVGHSITNAYTFDGTQVQLKVGGSTSWTIGSNAQVVTDPIAYAFNGSNPILVSVEWNTSSLSSAATSINFTETSATPGAGIAGNNTLSSPLGPTPSTDYLVPLVEIFF